MHGCAKKGQEPQQGEGTCKEHHAQSNDCDSHIRADGCHRRDEIAGCPWDHGPNGPGVEDTNETRKQAKPSHPSSIL